MGIRDQCSESCRVLLPDPPAFGWQRMCPDSQWGWSVSPRLTKGMASVTITEAQVAPLSNWLRAGPMVCHPSSGRRAFLGSRHPTCLAAGVLSVGAVRWAREVTAGRELVTWGTGVRTQACSPGDQRCPFRKLPHNTHPLGVMSKPCHRDQLGL